MESTEDFLKDCKMILECLDLIRRKLNEMYWSEIQHQKDRLERKEFKSFVRSLRRCEEKLSNVLYNVKNKSTNTKLGCGGA
jgi:hypothetical protein